MIASRPAAATWPPPRREPATSARATLCAAVSGGALSTRAPAATGASVRETAWLTRATTSLAAGALLRAEVRSLLAACPPVELAVGAAAVACAAALAAVCGAGPLVCDPEPGTIVPTD